MIDIFLYSGGAPAVDITLSDPTVLRGGGVIVDADGASVGLGESSVVGVSIFSCLSEAAGIAASVVAAVSLWAAVSASAADSGAAGAGVSVAAGVGAISGVGSVSSVSGATAAGVASSTGLGAGLGSAAIPVGAVASSAGVTSIASVCCRAEKGLFIFAGGRWQRVRQFPNSDLLPLRRRTQRATHPKQYKVLPRRLADLS